MLDKSISKKKDIKKKIIVYLIIMVLDIGIIIYSARRNILHFIDLNNKTVTLGGTKRILFGKNYITLVVTFFFYIYICLVNKFIFKEKKKEWFYVVLFLLLIIINILLFVAFSKRVY